MVQRNSWRRKGIGEAGERSGLGGKRGIRLNGLSTAKRNEESVANDTSEAIQVDLSRAPCIQLSTNTGQIFLEF